MGRSMTFERLAFALRSRLFVDWQCFVLAGCGGPAKLPVPQPQPVHGTVLYQGKPAAGFRVSFNPLAERRGREVFAPSALTNENGDFQLRSYHENDGAPSRRLYGDLRLAAIGGERWRSR